MEWLDASGLDRFRREEHTGANRCLPCTVLNVSLLALLGGLVALWVAPLGVAVLCLGLAVIYLRGYLVPYTPWLTRRFLPTTVLRWFGKTPGEDPDLANPPAVLADLELLEPCPDRDDICLVPDFDHEWHQALATLRDDREAQRDQLGRSLDVPAEDVAIDESGSRVTAVVEGTTVGEWRSDAALLSDLAAASALETLRGDQWDAYDVTDQGTALAIIRAFVETCPACGGTVGLETREGEACCWTREVTTVRCRDCEARLLELDELAYEDGETTYI